MLQQEKWASRAPLEDMLMADVWDDSRMAEHTANTAPDAKGKPGA